MVRGDALVFLDLDHFKDLNDTLGHAAGDLELAGFGAALREQVRQGDTAARYGGEEFAVLVRGHGRAGAELLVQRLRDVWSRESSTTFSVGAALHEDGTQPNATLASADRAVYAAKASGRDRMCWSDGPETFGPSVRISSFGVGSRHRRDDDAATA
jgi:diguanylate cyclase (GGDEF)-like protein